MFSSNSISFKRTGSITKLIGVEAFTAVNDGRPLFSFLRVEGFVCSWCVGFRCVLRFLMM